MIEDKTKEELIEIIYKMIDIGKVYICSCGEVNREGYACAECGEGASDD